MSPRWRALALVPLLLGAFAAPVAAAPAPMKAKQPRAAGPTFEVGVSGTGLTVTAQGPSGDFGDDEELVLSKVADGYRVFMNGEDAAARLVAVAPCVGDGSQATTSVICPATVTIADINYTFLTSATLTAVTTGLNVRFTGGSGDDEFYSSSGNDKLNGGPGNDILYGDDEDGPYGNDTITGGSGVDVIDAFGGTNVVYAKDGIADKRVQCADPGIPGSSGTATWDVGLDKPIQCGQADEVPDRPEDFRASVGQWKGTGDNATIDVTFTWKKPTASQPMVKSYDLIIRAATGTLTYAVSDGSATSKVVTFSAKEVPSASYTAILTARNDYDVSGPAVTTFSTAPKLNPARDVKSTALSDRRQGVKVTWVAPADSPAATLTGYTIQRRVPAELREGPEWRDMITLGATSVTWVDPCLPPALVVTYRVTPMYDVPGSKTPAPGASAEVTAVSPSFVERPPAPTSSRVDFNGNFTINGRPIQVFLEATTTGPQVDVGECFGINYEYYHSVNSFVGVDTQPRGTRGESATSNPALYLSGIQANRPLSFRVKSAWVIDAEWRRSYGAGWNYEWVKDLAVLSGGNKSSTWLDATGSVYTSTTGVSVSNLAVKRDAGTFDYRVSWTPPAASDPNSANIRGYEVCSYSLINGVYSGLATNPKFPTYTTKMR
ncbi:MAG: calcium-binding protein, partial [Actinomycetota bacterium]